MTVTRFSVSWEIDVEDYEANCPEEAAVFAAKELFAKPLECSVFLVKDLSTGESESFDIIIDDQNQLLKII